jgi:hypothetical protein
MLPAIGFMLIGLLAIWLGPKMKKFSEKMQKEAEEKKRKREEEKKSK